MNLKLFINNYFPFTVRLIISKALLFYILYRLFFSLQLNTINYPLTSNVGEYSIKLLNTFVDPPNFSVKREFVNGEEFISSQIYFNDKKVVYIADGCNSLIIFVRYFSFIFCFPSRFWRKFFYLISGIVIIHLLNIFRCAGLAYINLYHYPYFDLTHDYWFKWILYGAMFVMWILYLRKVQFQHNPRNKEASIA